MAVEHVNITDPELHEPKGAAAQSANVGIWADGAGSTYWSKVDTNHIDSTSIFTTNKYSIAVMFTDVSTADFILLPCPYACTLNRVTTILHGTIATADDIITVTNSTGPATVGTITVTASGSVEGDRDTLNASSNNTFTAGSYVKIATDGASTNTIKLTVLLEFTRTAA